MSENKDLKLIKKLYGEKMMHLCREYFPTILDEEGKLSQILQDNFAPTKALYENLLAQHKLEDFRVYIFYLYEDKMTQQEIKSLKTPAELLDEAGYILYPECKTEKEIQSFKKYYAPGEELCTFRCNRLNTCRVWFAVKKDVENIKRENFKNPFREDEYGTSVISIQFTRVDGWLSIKNRYNHTVANPDSTFHNKLDNIILGLDTSFRKVFSLPERRVINSLQNGLLNFVLASDGRYYHYNTKIDDYYFCENNLVIDSDHISDFDKNACILMDNILVDKKNRTVEVLSKLFDYDDSCLDGLGEVATIDEIKSNNGDKDIIITDVNNQTIVFTINKYNQIIGYSNTNLTEVRKNFLAHNRYVKTVSLPNVTKIEDNFLNRAVALKSIDISKVETIGNSCMRFCKNIESLSLPNLKVVGSKFLDRSVSISSLYAPKLEKVGDSFLESNANLENIDFPNLCEIGSYFLLSNNLIKSINLPSVTTIGSHCLICNEVLEEIKLPKVKKIGANFLESNLSLKEIRFPLLESCGEGFLSSSTLISSINLPSLQECGNNFLMNANLLEKLDLPSLIKCEDYFLSYNKCINSVYMPNLKICGKRFLSDNVELSHIDLPSLTTVGDYFLFDNDSIKNLYLPKLKEAGNQFLYSDRKLEKAYFPELIQVGLNFMRFNIDAKIYAPKYETDDFRFVNDSTDEFLK